MRLTSKGQVTIPQDIRERLGLLPNTAVVFDVVGDAVRIRKAPGSRSRGDGLVARMRAVGAAQPRRMTTDELLALTRD
jgi:AbrB family looped-hinge helix DNA binding protein